MTADSEPKLWALVSGGKDSITLAHYLASQGRLAGLLHLDTGIAIPDLKPHLAAVADRFGWELKVYKTPASYDELVLKFGFPGPPMHSLFMHYLKGRPMEAFWKDFHQPLASGVRKLESKRRFGSVKPVSMYSKHVPIHAPLIDWSTERVWTYVEKNDLPLSPSYRDLHYSGDCLCGAFARPDEVHLLRAFYPEPFARIVTLEAKAKAAGVKRCGWGGGSTATGARSQTYLCFECEANPARVVAP